ncbi:MAG: serine protease [Gammaproteobacteria bacterium]|nr:serine protease [Gammaproteobacteria bacterium]
MPIGILKSSVQSLYILMLHQNQPLYSGTGFIVMSHFGPSLITSRHLVTGRNLESKRILSTSGLIPDRVKIAHNRQDELGEWIIKEELLYDDHRKPRWSEHPTLGHRANIIALPLNDVFDVEFIPYDLSNTGPELVIRLTDPINIIGFPFGLRGGISFPVWASGMVASEPAIDHFDLPTFLVDCRSRPGQAGAAVVAHSNGDNVVESGGRHQEFSGPVTRLLGIYGGRVNKQSDLGIVWRVSAIKELTDALGQTIQSQETDEMATTDL